MSTDDVVPQRKKLNVGKPKNETKREIALLIAQGLDNRDIGKKLNLSEITINQYLSEMYKIIPGVKSRTDLLLYVISNDYEISEETFS